MNQARQYVVGGQSPRVPHAFVGDSPHAFPTRSDYSAEEFETVYMSHAYEDACRLTS